jgi:hypothetical protein
MLSKTVTLSASKTEFVFSDGKRESRFRPVVFLHPKEKKVLAIGSAPMDGSAFVTVDVFQDRSPAVDASLVLESKLRFGMRSLATGFLKMPPLLRICVAEDISADLRGFAPAIFRTAAIGAGGVVVEFEKHPDTQAKHPTALLGRG